MIDWLINLKPKGFPSILRGKDGSTIEIGLSEKFYDTEMVEDLIAKLVEGGIQKEDVLILESMKHNGRALEIYQDGTKYDLEKIKKIVGDFYISYIKQIAGDDTSI